MRGPGAVVAALGKNGTYFHFDPEFGPLIGRAELSQNVFDMSPAGYAAEGTVMRSRFGTQPSRAWFP